MEARNQIQTKVMEMLRKNSSLLKVVTRVKGLQKARQGLMMSHLEMAARKKRVPKWKRRIVAEVLAAVSTPRTGEVVPVNVKGVVPKTRNEATQGSEREADPGIEEGGDPESGAAAVPHEIKRGAGPRTESEAVLETKRQVMPRTQGGAGRGSDGGASRRIGVKTKPITRVGRIASGGHQAGNEEVAQRAVPGAMLTVRREKRSRQMTRKAKKSIPLLTTIKRRTKHVWKRQVQSRRLQVRMYPRTMALRKQ